MQAYNPTRLLGVHIRRTLVVVSHTPGAEVILDPLAFAWLIPVAHARKLGSSTACVNVSSITPRPFATQLKAGVFYAELHMPGIKETHKRGNAKIVTASLGMCPLIFIIDRGPERCALPTLSDAGLPQPA